MSQHYREQATGYVIGSESAGATLTGTYAENVNNITTKGKSQMQVYVEYVPAENGAYCMIQLERGPAADNFFKFIHTGSTEGTEEWIFREIIVPGDITTVADTTYKYAASIPVADEYLRLSIKEAEVKADYGTVKIIVTTSG